MPRPKRLPCGLPAWIPMVRLATGWTRLYRRNGRVYAFPTKEPLTFSTHDLAVLRAGGAIEFRKRTPLALLGHVRKRGMPPVWFLQGNEAFHAIVLDEGGAVISMEAKADDPTDAVRRCIAQFHHIESWPLYDDISR